MTPFTSSLATRLVFGSNQIDHLAEYVEELGGSKILVVTDPGIMAAGHLERILRVLARHTCSVVVFDQVIENPTTETVAECVEVAREIQPDLLIALGGGSPIDTAKGCNLVLSWGGRIEDYWIANSHPPSSTGGSRTARTPAGEGVRVGLAPALSPVWRDSRHRLPLIAIPTTAGTGSEVQSFALISNSVTHAKMACGGKNTAPALALLDPTLTITQPHSVTIHTGLDALAHSLETAVTTKRNSFSALFSREAFKLLSHSFGGVVPPPSESGRFANRPDTSLARAAMLLGSCYAGIAIENSMLGAAHALANPLTARYDLIHGKAVALMLPPVIQFNAELPDCRELYQQHLTYAGYPVSLEETPLFLIRKLQEWMDLSGLPTHLSEYGIPHEDLSDLARAALEQWTGRFNPRPLTHANLLSLYQSVF